MCPGAAAGGAHELELEEAERAALVAAAGEKRLRACGDAALAMHFTLIIPQPPLSPSPEGGMILRQVEMCDVTTMQLVM